jgi:TM2 domain-containing membrane protein YozV
MVDLKPPAVGEQRRARAPKPSTAGWLSLVPGVGQLYNREPGKAIVFFAGVPLLIGASLSVPALTDLLLGWWAPRGQLMVIMSLVVEMISLLVFVGLFLAALVFWYAAAHDARVTARAVSLGEQPGGRWWLFHR